MTGTTCSIRKWTKKILIRDPLASGTMRTVFGMLLARSVQETGSPGRGYEWLRRLDAQTKEYLQQPALMIEKLNRQEGLVTIWELTDLLWQRKRGSPLAFHFPASGTPVIDDSLGLVKGARHPEEAKAFIELVGSLEGQASPPARHSGCRPAPTCPPNRCRSGPRRCSGTGSPPRSTGTSSRSTGRSGWPPGTGPSAARAEPACRS